MAATVIVAVRQALTAALDVLPAFVDVPVTFAYRPTDSREYVFTRAASFNHKAAAMKSGRNFRTEVGTFEVVIFVEFVGGGAEDAATRALELGLAVEEYVADHKQGIGAAYTLQVAGDGTLQEAVLDSSSMAELVYPIHYDARLT